MRIIYDSIRVLLPSSPFLFLPSPACCGRAVASSVPSTGSTLTQLDARHELNSRVILSGIVKGMYTLLQISYGLQVYFLGTRWRTTKPWSTIYEVGCCAFQTAFGLQDGGTGGLLSNLTSLWRDYSPYKYSFVLQNAFSSNIYYKVAFAMTTAWWILSLSLMDYRHTAHFCLCASQQNSKGQANVIALLVILKDFQSGS